MIGHLHRASSASPKFTYFRKGDTSTTLDWTTNRQLATQVGAFSFNTSPAVPFSQTYWMTPTVPGTNTSYLALNHLWFKNSMQGTVEFIVDAPAPAPVSQLVAFNDNIGGTRYLENNIYVGGGQQNIVVINGTQYIVGGAYTSPMYVLMAWLKRNDGTTVLHNKWYSISGTILTLICDNTITTAYPPFNLLNQDTDSTVWTSFNGLSFYLGQMSMFKVSDKYYITPSKDNNLPGAVF